MKYIHPDDPAILAFSARIASENAVLETVCRNLFACFDANIAYSRLGAPFFPLQRSDLNVLQMRSGTCGDYASLLVSVLSSLGFDAQYAYVHRDCYGDEQDHICAAVQENGRCILIDATQPYRKFHGFDCPHQDYELLSPAAFEQKMQQEEVYWLSVARKHGNDLLAGLFYAPWLHSESVLNLPDRLEDIFLLLILDGQLEPTLYAYYQRYTAKEGFIPLMAEISRAGTVFRVSIHPCGDLWDNAQWGPAFKADEIPSESIRPELNALQRYLPYYIRQTNGILHQAGCAGLG